MIETNINIGLLIERKLQEKGVSKSELARRIGIANQNVNRLLSKPSIDTDKLAAISRALGYNFFAEYMADGRATASGDGSVAVSGNNNSHIGPGQGGGEAEVLKERVKSLEALLEEKERLIGILMDGRKG